MIYLGVGWGFGAAQMETPHVWRGWEGEDISSQPIRGLWSAVSSPSGIWAGAPAEIELTHFVIEMHLVG